MNRELAAAPGPATTAKRIGKYLRKLSNRSMGGLVLQRVGRDEHGVVWAVLQVPTDLHAASGFSTSEST